MVLQAEYLNFQLCFSFIRFVLSLLLLSGVCHCVCLWAYFYATKMCIRCRPSLYIFRSLLFYLFLIFADIKFKVSLISLLYTPNKVLPSFCWNLHLTLVHCHKRCITNFQKLLLDSFEIKLNFMKVSSGLIGWTVGFIALQTLWGYFMPNLVKKIMINNYIVNVLSQSF